jgi:hypothetical protein
MYIRTTGPSPGNGTESDSYTISITVSDGDGGYASGPTGLTVENVLPSVEFAQPGTAYEGSGAILAGVTAARDCRSDSRQSEYCWKINSAAARTRGASPRGACGLRSLNLIRKP